MGLLCFWYEEAVSVGKKCNSLPDFEPEIEQCINEEDSPVLCPGIMQEFLSPLSISRTRRLRRRELRFSLANYDKGKSNWGEERDGNTDSDSDLL